MCFDGFDKLFTSPERHEVSPCVFWIPQPDIMQHTIARPRPEDSVTPAIGPPPETPDNLLASVARPYTRVLYPFGFEVHFESNSPEVLQAAEECFGAWRKRFHAPAMTVRCLVSESGQSRTSQTMVYRCQHHLLTGFADSENFFCCDLASGFAFSWVTLATEEDAAFLRYPLLDNIVGALTWALHVTAVHSACVVYDGHGVLLAGRSGAGKSSLAYACARSGWTYVSDDTSSLVRCAATRTVIGNPHKFRFRENAGRLFPEFSHFPESRRGDGRPMIEVATSALSGISIAEEASADYVVFLNRQDGDCGGAQFLPIPQEQMLTQLFAGNWPTDLPARAEDWATLHRLKDVPAYELRYRELDVAVEALQNLVLRGEA